jgi:predicted Zn-dependent peptidase
MYEMGKNLLHDKPIDTPEIVLDNINNIGLDDIDRVVNKYLLWDQMNLSYVGPIGNVQKLNEELKTIFI